MTTQSLDHYNVFTEDLDGTIAFYTDIIGLTDGPRPPFDWELYTVLPKMSL